jgi:hypothetical protein
VGSIPAGNIDFFCNNDRENSLLLFLFYGACVKQNTIFLLTYDIRPISDQTYTGSVTVTIMEIGSYEGTTGTTFQITSRSIGEITVEKIGKSTVFFGGGVVQYFI